MNPEQRPSPQPPAYDVQHVELTPQATGVVRGRVDVSGIADFLGSAFEEVTAAAAQQGRSIAGPPFARYAIGPDGFAVEAGFPLDDAIPIVGQVEPSALPGGPALRILHVGAYDAVSGAYEAGERWLRHHGRIAAGLPWECYLDGPEVALPRTEVYFPYRAEPGADQD